MKKQHITIHDIARELNISASTVSRALHDHPRISKATRKAVLDLAKKYNYQPNVMASSLRRGSSKMVGVIVPRINRSFFAQVIGGMEESLAASGYQLMICQSNEKLEKEEAAISTLIHARVDAVILSLSMETHHYEHIRSLKEKGIRTLFFDRIPGDIQAPSVVVDDKLGAYLAVKHLLDSGYRRISHLAGPKHISIYRDRMDGYLQAMNEADIAVLPEWIMEEELVQAGGERAFEKAMHHGTSPEAFFCSGDFAALGVIQAARNAGLRVPGDLAVSGFSNEPFTAFLEPSLTTVEQHGGEIGREVAELFLQEDAYETNRQVVIKPELIIRNSTKSNIKPK